MKRRFPLVLLILLLFSCEKKYEVDSFYDCQDDIITDTSKLQTKLIGFWQLKEISCGLCSGQFPKKADVLVVVNFKADNSFVIQEGFQIIDEGQWEIAESDSDTSFFIRNERSQYLNGAINICGNRLYADLTYVDGQGFYYEKTK